MIVGKKNNGHKQYFGFANDHKVKHHYKQLTYGYIFNQHKLTFTMMPTYISFVGKNPISLTSDSFRFHVQHFQSSQSWDFRIYEVIIHQIISHKDIIKVKFIIFNKFVSWVLWLPCSTYLGFAKRDPRSKRLKIL